MSASEHDDRRFERLERVLNGLPTEVAVLTQRVSTIEDDVIEDRETLKALVLRLEHRDKEQRDERKSDRRWLITTAIGVGMMLIAAAALLAGKVA